MDGTISQLAVFLGATFAAALVAGVTGFAFALIAAAAWLHVLTPLETATLTVGYGIIVQGYGTWKLRHAISWSRIWPFLPGGAAGVAIGVMVLRWANPTHMRMGIAAFLVAYSLYGLARPALKPVRAGAFADGVAGFLGGMLGAMAGFPGILVVIWCGLRGWPRDIQRGVFQPVSVALLAMSATVFGVTGSISRHVMELYLLGLPALALGTWAGFALYGRLDEETFRKMVLMVLLASGLFLLVSMR
jgi:uncharacterized membrane protein YfcA